uniref:Pre-mRNA cleavage factor Im 25 kDa subunit n=1 Tax=Pyramimonas obovata TaxID=1411642 RepID=A0A7S0N1Q4_9CHLO|mmetsp:Transcript_17557/g.38279  ORF Transcript_17557/g.38279 Transcript_17557/m.38279 type:complete len:203 (+) Transcript_17557:381-989(+)
METYHSTIQKSLHLYPVSNYTIGTKTPKVQKYTTANERFQQMKDKYAIEGVRRSVEAIVLVQEHNHPHILLLQVSADEWRLPGGRLRPGEGEVEGLQRKLVNKLAPAAGPPVNWEISECAGVWWRPNFESHVYPYLPPHITKPKECTKIYVVQMPERCTLAVPKNFKLLAVPLFELYEKAQRYGPSIAAIPQLLSRFNISMT